MKKVWIFLSILLNLLLVQVSAAQNECKKDSVFPQVGNCGYNVSNYDLDMTWKPEGDWWDVRETITVTSEWDTDELIFDFAAGYEITSLTVDGASAKYEYDGDKLIVHHPYGQGFTHDKEYRLYAAFEGKLQWRFIRDPEGETRTNPEKGFCMFNEPYYSRYYYICNDHPRDKATYHYSFTVPAGFTPAGVGRLIDMKVGTEVRPVNGEIIIRNQKDISGGPVTFTYKQEYPSAPYLFAVCAEPYDMNQQVLDDGKVRLDFVSLGLSDLDDEVKEQWEYYYDVGWEYAPELAWEMADLQPEIIQALEAYFGPYPYEDLGLIISQFVFSDALETQGRSIIDPLSMLEEILAHEIAHQWFGDLISLEDWSDVWLKEGAASYGEALWAESQGGKEAYEEYLMYVYDYIVNGDTFITPIDEDTIDGLRSYYEESSVPRLNHDAAVNSISAFCRIDRSRVRLKEGDAAFEDFAEGLQNSCESIIISGKSLNTYLEMLGLPLFDWIDHFVGPKEVRLDDINELYGLPAYYGGMILYHCLRERLGDETFIKALQTLIEENKWSTVNEEKFIEVFSRVSGENLSGFIRSYLYYGKNGHAPDLLGIASWKETRIIFEEPEPEVQTMQFYVIGPRFPELCRGCSLPNTGFSSRKAAPLSVQPASAAYQDLNMSLLIPVLDVETELVGVPLSGNTWPVDWLDDRAGLLAGSALPGEGYSVIAAHNTLNDTAYGPFALLSTLETGDVIFVDDGEGMLRKFSVFANELLMPDDFTAMAAIAEREPGALVLVTCENESPEGGYLNRRVVFAKQ